MFLLQEGHDLHPSAGTVVLTCFFICAQMSGVLAPPPGQGGVLPVVHQKNVVAANGAPEPSQTTTGIWIMCVSVQVLEEAQSFHE